MSEVDGVVKSGTMPTQAEQPGEQGMVNKERWETIGPHLDELLEEQDGDVLREGFGCSRRRSWNGGRGPDRRGSP